MFTSHDHARVMQIRFQPKDACDHGERSGNAIKTDVGPKWCMHSGAIDHLTSDLDRLHINELALLQPRHRPGR
jgi:hypothetical protein